MESKWRRYLRFFGPNLREDIDDELGFHIDAKTRELIEAGQTPEEARKQALRHFGDTREVAGLCREIGESREKRRRYSEWLDGLMRDLRGAVRGLRRAPGFSAIAIFTLAVGVAGACSLFSIVESWILRSVRFPEPDQLLYVQSLAVSRGRDTAVTMADFLDIQSRATSTLQSAAAWTFETFRLGLEGGRSAERVQGARVSANFFDVLRANMAQGRGFLPEDGRAGAERVAIVSRGFWKTRLQSAGPGARIVLDGESYAVAGVLPEQFHFVLTGRANVWIPLIPQESERARRVERFLQVVARRKPGATLDQARRELGALATDLSQKYPDTNSDIGSFCIPLAREIGRHSGEDITLIVFGVTIGLLLIACTNVANLLLVRAQARKREASIHMSLGASRARLVRRTLMETLLLFGIAAVLGTLAGYAMISGLLVFLPHENRGFLPDYGEVYLNWKIFAFAFGLASIAGVAFGIAPALESARAGIVSVLKESGSAVSASVRANRLRGLLAGAQVMLAVVLLSSTILLVATFRKTWDRPRGFDGNDVLTLRIGLDPKQYRAEAQRIAYFDSVLTGLSGESAVARFIPFGNNNGGTAIEIAGETNDDGAGARKNQKLVRFNAVSPGYFGALRIAIRKGRGFRESDGADAPATAVVNETLAKRYFAGRDAVGQRIRAMRLNGRECEIVGVAADTLEDTDTVHPMLYVPFAQAPSTEAVVLLRKENAPASLPEIRRRVAAVDSQQPIYDVKTIGDRILERVAPYQLISGMLGWFGLLALLLAAVGVYGVIAYSAAQRTREIGIRSALGADRESVLRLFLRQGWRIVQWGLIPGVLGAYAVSRMLGSAVMDLSVIDPVLPILGAVALIAAAAVVATLAPAWRAASADPLAAIRHE